MEAAALAGLLGVGYVVSRLAGVKPKGATKTGKEGFDPVPTGTESSQMTFKPGSQTVALTSPPTSALAQTPQGSSAVGPASMLDLMYQTPNGQT